jgi:anti-sigma factor RsiW
MTARRRRLNGHDLTCQQAVALVTAYLDDALARDARALFEAHLDECDMCTEHLKQIRATIAVACRVGADDLDPLAREDLMDLYRRWRSDPGSP